MQYFLGLMCVACFTGVLSAFGEETDPQSRPDVLERQLWQTRPLVIASPDADHEKLASQLERLDKVRDGLVDRDMVVFEVIGDAATLDGKPLDESAARQLRDYLTLDADRFAVLLIGKDGGVKLRQEDTAEMQDIFDLIDSMPMRQREMRERDG